MEGALIIKEARRRAGISQAQLARRLGTKQPVIARWEAGRAAPSLETTKRAVRACGFEIDLRVVPIDASEDRSIESRLRLTPARRLARNADMLRTERWAAGARVISR